MANLTDELLARETFDTLPEARALIERWRVNYNTVRPHSSLGYRPPTRGDCAFDDGPRGREDRDRR